MVAFIKNTSVSSEQGSYDLLIVCCLQRVYQECLRMSLTFFLRVSICNTSICNTVYICLWFMFVRVRAYVGRGSEERAITLTNRSVLSKYDVARLTHPQYTMFTLVFHYRFESHISSS